MLTGHSLASDGYLYELLRPVADNTFEVVHTFHEVTGWSGLVPSQAADVDCDGLEELLLDFYPQFESWEWDPIADSFVQGCVWDSDVFGTFVHYNAIDLNQDGVPEWGTVNHYLWFQAFEEQFCATPDSGLVSWWPLDEDSALVSTDVWGVNDGVWVGHPLAASGYVAGALELDGSGSFVRVADNDSVDFGTGDLSLEMWIRTSVSTPVAPLTSKLDEESEFGWALWLENGNSLHFTLADGTPGDYLSETVATIGDGAWHHVAVCADRDIGNGLRFYLDSSPIGTASLANHSGSISTDVDLLIGACSLSPGDTNFFDGTLDEVSVYRSALDSAEVRCIYLADSRGKCQPDTSCNCPSQADIEPDGFLTAIDLAGEIDALFAGGTNPRDTWCPTYRFDLDCDEFTTALDLSILIDHLFAGGTGPCDPCAN